MKRIWVDRHAVETRRDGVLIVTDPDSNVTRCSEVKINGPCRIVYDPTVEAGVRVWIETDADLETK